MVASIHQKGTKGKREVHKYKQNWVITAFLLEAKAVGFYFSPVSPIVEKLKQVGSFVCLQAKR